MTKSDTAKIYRPVRMLRTAMAEQEAKAAQRCGDFPHLKSVMRIARIPFVDSGLTVVISIYTRIKTSNPVFHWSLERAEGSVYSILEQTKPAVAIFNGPITMLDALLCSSLDLVEEKVPVVTLPPELIYVSTKDYVSNALVRPVLKRAGSVKQFGVDKANTVLASKYTQYAAHQLDSALDIADKYVDEYLPPDGADAADVIAEDKTDAGGSSSSSQAAAQHAMHHVDVFSRKLQRRLTRRTIAEAKALKKQSVDAISFMINMAELLAKDPKAAMEKASILWAHLSEDEPENQARPQNLEQLTVMVSREVARRAVHLVNYARLHVATLPRGVLVAVHKAVAAFAQLADTIVKKTHLETARNRALSTAQLQASRLHSLLVTLNSLANQILEILAAKIAGKQQQSNGNVNNINNDNNSHTANHRSPANNLLHNSFE